MDRGHSDSFREKKQNKYSQVFVAGDFFVGMKAQKKVLKKNWTQNCLFGPFFLIISDILEGAFPPSPFWVAEKCCNHDITTLIKVVNYLVPGCFAAVQKMFIVWTENEHATTAKR